MEQATIKKFFQAADPNAPRVFSIRSCHLQPVAHVPKAKRPVGRPRKAPLTKGTPVREATPVEDTPPPAKKIRASYNVIM